MAVEQSGRSVVAWERQAVASAVLAAALGDLVVASELVAVALEDQAVEQELQAVVLALLAEEDSLAGLVAEDAVVADSQVLLRSEAVAFPGDAAFAVALVGVVVPWHSPSALALDSPAVVVVEVVAGTVVEDAVPLEAPLVKGPAGGDSLEMEAVVGPWVKGLVLAAEHCSLEG